jgi:hypothetical protein
MSALHLTFYIGLGISLAGVLISYFRGETFIYDAQNAKPKEPIAPVQPAQGAAPISRGTESPQESGKTGDPGR